MQATQIALSAPGLLPPSYLLSPPCINAQGKLAVRIPSNTDGSSVPRIGYQQSAGARQTRRGRETPTSRKPNPKNLQTSRLIMVHEHQAAGRDFGSFYAPWHPRTNAMTLSEASQRVASRWFRVCHAPSWPS
ncbi:hypothetical protein LY78DRAFT_146027 [Colletotrichum sublineola]|nr:hypothetical protein LY78DRAFT_146027 [Colletotrichum sublineola]